MGKLNIAHHKSYHPYRRDNIERVRRDEEEARLKKLKEEGKMLMTDSEARITSLRNKSKGKDIAIPANDFAGSDSLVDSHGHVNLFNPTHSNQVIDSTGADSLARALIRKEEERGIALAPSDKDLKPWYTTDPNAPLHSRNPDKATRSTKSKVATRLAEDDPLTVVRGYVQKKNAEKKSGQSSKSYQDLSDNNIKLQDQLTAARLKRESIEKTRAAALLRQRHQVDEMSSTSGSPFRQGYTDVYNRRETSEAWRRRRNRS
ncbi:hypothetical protein FRC02_000135 [Tulasnella sp. 418]|nr:hypothetical protein FRC02_000135 [Tulasnella sp. 418]